MSKKNRHEAAVFLKEDPNFILFSEEENLAGGIEQTWVKGEHPEGCILPEIKEEPLESTQGNFVCHVCGKGFTNQSDLSRHELTYRRKNRCSICSKTFSRKDQLKRHRRLHVEVLVEEESAKSTEESTCTDDDHTMDDVEDCKPQVGMAKIKEELQTHTGIEATGETSQQPSAESPSESIKRPKSSRLSSKHHRKHHGKKYSCKNCDKSYDDELKLNHHLRTHTGSAADHVCLICDKHFPEAKNLKRHQQTVHTNPPKGKKLKAKEKKSSKTPKAHNSKTASLIPKSESLEASSYDSFEDNSVDPDYIYSFLKEEMESDEGEVEDVIFDCIYCFRAFMSRDELHEHTVKVHNMTRAVNFGDLDRLPEYKNKIYKCTMCEKSFSRNNDLERHMNVHKEMKEFSCTVCGRSFDDAQRLEHHMKIHSTQRDITCKICGKSYQTMRNLRRHESSVHEGYKPFKCQEEGCNRSFSRKDKYTVHIKKSHTISKV